MRRDEDVKRAAAVDAMRVKAADAICSYLRRGEFVGSKSQLRDAASINRTQFYGALTDLIQANRVTVTGGERSQRIALVGGPGDE